MNRKEVLDKYSTGCRYISPAAMDYFDDSAKIKTSYWCEANPKELFIDYVSHIDSAPSNRCHQNKFDKYGVLRTDEKLTVEEHEWARIEYVFRMALSKDTKNNALLDFVI